MAVTEPQATSAPAAHKTTRTPARRTKRRGLIIRRGYQQLPIFPSASVAPRGTCRRHVSDGNRPSIMSRLHEPFSRGEKTLGRGPMSLRPRLILALFAGALGAGSFGCGTNQGPTITGSGGAPGNGGSGGAPGNGGSGAGTG